MMTTTTTATTATPLADEERKGRFFGSGGVSKMTMGTLLVTFLLCSVLAALLHQIPKQQQQQLTEHQQSQQQLRLQQQQRHLKKEKEAQEEEEEEEEDQDQDEEEGEEGEGQGQDNSNNQGLGGGPSGTCSDIQDKWQMAPLLPEDAADLRSLTQGGFSRRRRAYFQQQARQQQQQQQARPIPLAVQGGQVPLGRPQPTQTQPPSGNNGNPQNNGEQNGQGQGLGQSGPTKPRLHFPTAQSGIDRQFVLRMNMTMNLQLIMWEYIEGDYEGDPIIPPTQQEALDWYGLDYYRYFVDNNDAAVVARSSRDGGQDPGVCYAIFRATTSLSDPDDLLQNFWPFNRVIPGTDCQVKDGYYRGGLLNDYTPAFDAALEECLDLCLSEPTNDGSEPERCPLLIGGLSSGGAIATVASIVYRDLNPQVINFGGLRAILDNPDYPCTDAKSENHYRFSTSNRFGEYDFSANVDFPNDSKQVGNHINLDETNWPLLSLGLDETRTRIPTNQDIHHWSNYDGAIQQMLRFDDSCFPIPLEKWPLEHVCGYSDECASRVCVLGKCAVRRLQSGATCESSQDCQSGQCGGGGGGGLLDNLSGLFDLFGDGGDGQSGTCQ